MTAPQRFLFIGGLHRSGTSLVTRLITGLPGVSGITRAPVPENEGAYLQGAIPHDALSGRPMHFATDPDQHMTESHPLNTLATRERLLADWSPWFDPGAAWWVEKSPVNLTRMRLLQQLFPLAQFIVVTRHPEAVAAAVTKWVNDTPMRLLDHWLDAHDRVAADLAHLHAVLVLRYEDLVGHPEATCDTLAAFLSLPSEGRDAVDDIRDGNADYIGAPVMTAAQMVRASHWGYGPALHIVPEYASFIRHPLRAVASATRNRMERRTGPQWLAL